MGMALFPGGGKMNIETIKEVKIIEAMVESETNQGCFYKVTRTGWEWE